MTLSATTTSSSSASQPLGSRTHFIPREHLKFDEKNDRLTGTDVGFGIVYRGTYQEKPVAIKVIKTAFKNLSNKNKKLLSEIDNSMNLNHDNFLAYTGWSHDSENIYIVSPFIEKGSLLNILQKEKLTSEQKLSYTLDIVQGLLYLHNNNVIHRDVKASNVLIDNNNVALVNDLGIGKLVREKEKKKGVLEPLTETWNKISASFDLRRTSAPGHTVGSTHTDLLICEIPAAAGKIDLIVYPWMAPEVARGDSHSFASDMYMFGSTLFELLTGQHPFKQELEAGQIQPQDLYKVKKEGKLPVVPNLSEINQDQTLAQLYLLMLKCLSLNAADRPTAFQALAFLFKMKSQVLCVASASYDTAVLQEHKCQIFKTLGEAITSAKALPVEQKVSILVFPGTYKEEDELILDRENTYILGHKESIVKGSLLNISQNNIALESLHLEPITNGEEFIVNVVFSSPTIARCYINGAIIIVGDESSTKPVITQNTIKHSNALSCHLGVFKGNQFLASSSSGNSSKLVKRDSQSTIGKGAIAQSIAKEIEKKDVSAIDLSDNRITDSSIKHIAKSLAKTHNLVSMDLSLNKIGDNGMKSLVEAVTANASTLTSLDLSDNKITKVGAKALIKTLESNTVLKRLTLSYNQIGRSGGKHFGILLSKNTGLTNLDISYNKIGDAGAKFFLDNLPTNTTLAKLDLRHNDLSEGMQQKLLEVADKKEGFKMYV